MDTEKDGLTHGRVSTSIDVQMNFASLAGIGIIV